MSDAKAFENEYISRRAAIAARGRTCNDNCLECDFAIEGDSWCNGEVFVVDLLRIPAADVVPASVFRDCRNELCLKCGAYTQKHLGACDGCRWREADG